MKKKIEALLKDGSLGGNAEYASVHKAHQSAKRALERAKKEKLEAKQTYGDALGNGEKDQDRLFELLTDFRRAKHMHRFQLAGYKLAKHRLTRWLEGFLKTAEVPHETVKIRAAKPKVKKTAQGKTTKAKAAQPAKASKAAGKLAKKAN